MAEGAAHQRSNCPTLNELYYWLLMLFHLMRGRVLAALLRWLLFLSHRDLHLTIKRNMYHTRLSSKQDGVRWFLAWTLHFSSKKTLLWVLLLIRNHFCGVVRFTENESAYIHCTLYTYIHWSGGWANLVKARYLRRAVPHCFQDTQELRRTCIYSSQVNKGRLW